MAPFSGERYSEAVEYRVTNLCSWRQSDV